MKDLPTDSETAMSILHGCLVVTLQGELYADRLMKIRADILQKIQATKVRGMVLDLSTVRVLDSPAFNCLAGTARMASLLGVVNVFVGLQPGVVSSLVDLEVDIDGVRAALTVEDGFEQIQNLLAIQEGVPDDEAPERIGDENDERESGGE
ncbi:MAG: STAS domain-containing protein [Desulfobacterales bacterium]|jgi:rsbT antagonist protein RsbS